MKQSNVPWKLLLAGALITQTACVDGAESLLILQNQLPGEECAISTDREGITLGSGTIDVMAGNGYVFTPLLLNKLEDSSDGRLVFLEGANVDIDFALDEVPGAGIEAELDAGNFLHFRQAFSGSLEPGSLSSYQFEIVSKDVLRALEAVVTPEKSVVLTASVAIVGTFAGSEITSNTFKYPIKVCSGCLTNVIGSCSALPSGDVSTGGSCQPLQDGVLDCCTNTDGSLTCPAVEFVPDPV